VTGRGRTCDAPRFKRALYRLSYGHVKNGRSRDRTGGLLLIREALCQLSYPPSTSLVCPAPAGELDAHAAAGPRFGHHGSGRWPFRQRTCLCHSPTLRPWIARPGAQRPTWRGVGARCSQSVTVIWQAKVTRAVTREIQRHIVEDLSLSSGASSTDRTFQAEHHLLVGSS
jgi:hypothetical protein